jgi:PIN domain nuclease of toxin-antitoxin system
MDTYTLDACALLSLLWAEPGSEIVGGIYEKASNNEANLIMHKINLLEVYNKIFQKHGLFMLIKFMKKSCNRRSRFLIRLHSTFSKYLQMCNLNTKRTL